MSGLVRVLLGLVVLAAPSAAGATMLWNSGGGVTAKTCSAGDFFTAVDGSGNFTCSTASGSGDVTAVGDCASGACFDGTTGTTLTFKNATSGTIAVTPVAGALGTRTISLPAETGTICTTGSVCSGYQASGSYAPANATYITQTADATLSAEQAMGALGTGLVKNTTTTGVQSIYAGTSCTNQFPRSLDASGAATCASVNLTAAADVTGTLPNANTTAVSTNTNSAIVTRDGSGNFAAGTITASLTGAASLNTLLAGRTGSGNNTIISTDDNGQITLANSGATGSSKTGKLYGSGKTGENLLLQPNSANTTTGSVKVDGYLDFWPSIATNSSQVNVAGFSPTVTLSDGGGYSLIDSNPTLSIPDWSAIQIFRARGSIDRTGTTGGTLYQYTGFHMGTTFTSSTTGGPLFQDAFFDASVINQVANTATQNTYQPISFLSKPTYKASSGATLTIGQTVGVDINPSWGVGGGGTLTNTTFSAFKLHTPNEIGGTLSLPTYIALDVEDLDTAGVTTPLSLRSVGTTTEMRHAGPARFGATGAVTSGKKLDVQGDAYIGGYLDIGDDIADLTTNTVNVVDIAPTVDISSTGQIVGVSVAPTTSATSGGDLTGIKVAPAWTNNGASTAANIQAVWLAGTYAAAQTSNISSAYVLRHDTAYSSATAGSAPILSTFGVYDFPTMTLTAASGTGTAGTYAGVYHAPTLTLNSGGGATATFSLTEDVGLKMSGAYTKTAGTALNITSRIGLLYNEVTTSGTVALTDNIAVDVKPLTKGGTTNAALRSAVAAASNQYFLKDDGGAQSKFTGKITTYNNIATAGFGLPIIVADSGVSATKTANFTSTSFTPPATAGAYRGSWVITTTSGTNTGTVQCTVDYVDSQGTTHTGDIIPMASAAGTFGTTGTAASKQFRCGPWPLNINNAGTAIAMKVVITGSVNYTVQTILEQTS